MSSRLDHSEQSGFSLVMSLIFISLLSVLVVGFLTSMRVEVFSADAALQAAKSSNMAQAATDMAIARLQYATGTYTPSMSIWASQPGQILMATRSSTTSSFSGWQRIDLHSGASTSTDGNIVADLNRGTSYLVTRSASKIPVCWIYVRKDGTLATTSGTTVPAYNALNPLVGRFAYWVDDECARVNLNTAATRATSSLSMWGSAAQVNLKAFGSTMSDTVITALDQYRTGVTGHYLHTLRDAKVISPALSNLVDNDAFSLTVNSQAPELNMFGEPRIVLTTQRRLAGNAPFLDILTTDTADPGNWSNLSAAKVKIVVGSLSQIFCRTDWPILPGTSFAGKFSPVPPQQLALNVIDYVRAKESRVALVEPLRGTPTNSTGFTLDGLSGTMMGNTRTLKITEIAFFVKETTPGPPKKYVMKIRAELHLPANSHVPTIDLKTLTLTHWISMIAGFTYYDGGTGIWGQYPIGGSNPTLSANVINASTLATSMNPGDYRAIEATTREFTLTGTQTISSITKIWPALSIMGTNTNCRLTVSTVHNALSFTYSSTLLESDVWPSMAVDDPALSEGNANWKMQTAADVTFGGPPTSNVSTLGQAPSATMASLMPDVDSVGQLTNIGMQFPPPASTSGNIYGVVESVAELGYIHTGIVQTNQTKGIPWRTLRLQPKSIAGQLPDWLLLDMFAAPKVRWSSLSAKSDVVPNTFSYYSQPQEATSILSTNQRAGGVINVNAQITPAFTTSTGTLTRTAPLKAAFMGVYTNAASSSTLSAADTIAVNIVKRNLATSGSLYGFTATDPFISSGQIVEMLGVTEGGEESENKLRGAIDTLTSRSSTFRVFSIGQSIMQSSAGSITVMGEKRVETVVERVVNDTDRNVKIRPISSQTPKS